MTAYIPSAENATTDQIVRSLKSIASGGTNAFGDVVLRAGQTTTIVNDDRFTAGRAIMLCPLSANAAAALATTWFDVSAMGAFTIHHANAASTDRAFKYVIWG